jgi:hypothetical protein
MDWAAKLGYSKESLVGTIHKSVEMFSSFRPEYEGEDTRIVFSGWAAGIECSAFHYIKLIYL